MTAAIALVVLAAIARRVRGRRRGAIAPPIPLAGPADGAVEYYAPSLIIEPGACFRLLRHGLTGTASACDRPVIGRGTFIDPRGASFVVEACALHGPALAKWNPRRQTQPTSEDPER